MDRPTEIVGESRSALDECERTGKAACGTGKQQDAGAAKLAVANSQICNAGRCAKEKSESRVLLDESWNGEQKSADECGKRWEPRGLKAQDQPDAEQYEERAIGIVKRMRKDAAGSQEDEGNSKQESAKTRGQSGINEQPEEDSPGEKRGPCGSERRVKVVMKNNPAEKLDDGGLHQEGQGRIREREVAVWNLPKRNARCVFQDVA